VVTWSPAVTTNRLTAWRRVLKNVIFGLPVKKFPALYWIRSFRYHKHSPLVTVRSKVNPVIRSYPVPLRPNKIWPSYSCLHMNRTSEVVTSIRVSWPNLCVHFSYFSQVLHVLHISSSLFHHASNPALGEDKQRSQFLDNTSGLGPTIFLNTHLVLRRP
jgi:hypothetical protein